MQNFNIYTHLNLKVLHLSIFITGKDQNWSLLPPPPPPKKKKVGFVLSYNESPKLLWSGQWQQKEEDYSIVESSLYVWYLQNWPLCDDLVAFELWACTYLLNRHNNTMNLMKEKQRGPIPMGLKRWPLTLIKHFANTICVSPSPAGPASCLPLNFLIRLIWVLVPNRCSIINSSLGRTKVLYATS